jgi:Fic family protein
VQADRQQGRTLFAMKSTGLKDHHAWTIEFLDGFKEKLTPSKWAEIAQCSQDLAIRDIQGLTERGIVMKEAAGGRSTNYVWKESGS